MLRDLSALNETVRELVKGCNGLSLHELDPHPAVLHPTYTGYREQTSLGANQEKYA